MADNFLSRAWRRAYALLAGQLFGGDRNLWEVLGYPATVNPETYRALYARGDIAARIVDSFPDATWRETPSIRKRGSKADDDFTKEVNELAERVKLWDTLHRLDRLMGLGHYGVLMLGLNGGEDTAKAATGTYALMYLTPHGETTAQITNWDADPRSPRYSQPLMYRLTTGGGWTGVGGANRSLPCHWSRTIHVAEHALEDKAIGSPRLERIINRLLDLEKAVGGSAEVWWQNAAQLRAWIADADATFSDSDKAALTSQLDELQHGLRRDVRVQGVKPESLTADAQSTNAAAIIDKLFEIIAGATGIPKRILMGSERGELSSEQDENNWAARIMERREQVATPHFIRPFIDRCIALGILRNPGKYDVVWPESDTLGEQARASIALAKSQAVSTYTSAPGADTVIAPEEFRRWLGEDITSEFELAEPDDVPAPGAAPTDPNNPGAEDPEAVAAFNRRQVLIDNSQPRPLYVRRDVLNWRDIAKWAKAQGFKTTVGEAMHVTIAYSRNPVDWLKISPDWVQKPGDLSGELGIAAGGPRVVEQLGDKGAVVLGFSSNDLQWRHEAILNCGASWDYEGFRPHITITYQGGDVNLDEIDPYPGAIELGPEIFEAIDDEYLQSLVENRRRER